MNPARMTEVDGIPVLLAPTAGPMTAGLMFRVGRADETLGCAGITHLVEHLALHRHGTADYHYNGMTSATTTQFVTQGTAQSVAGFLTDVCASLRSLPLQRLATEKKVLQTEAAGRGPAVTELMPMWRHGARDFGLVSYPEFGVHTLTEQMVEHWARTRFTRANAVLWIAGDEVPPGLRLDLPDGARMPLPAESNALPVMPAFYHGASRHLVLDARVPRNRAATLYTKLVERALFRRLRQDHGISYAANADYSTDGRAKATMTALADTQPGEEQRAVEVFLEVLHGLRQGDVEAAEFEAVRGLALAAFDNPEVEANLLPRRATDLLAGFPADSTETMLETFRAAAPEDVPEIAREVAETALLMVPESVRFVTGFEAAPVYSRFGVRGSAYRSRVTPGTTLVHGGDGVSITTPQGSITVLFDRCAAMLRWPDGARHLFGDDGIGIRVEPAVYPVRASVLAAIDSAVPAGAIVDMPERDKSAVPRPGRLAVMRTRWRAWRQALRLWSGRHLGFWQVLSPFRRAALVVLCVLFLLGLIQRAPAAWVSGVLLVCAVTVVYRQWRD